MPRTTLMLMVLLTALPVHAADLARGADREPRVPIRIRVYGGEALSADAHTAALATATAVLSSAGIDVTWTMCQPAPRPDEACGQPLIPGELAIRLLASAPGVPGHEARRSLGSALVTVEPGTSQMATVYIDRVAWLAGRARTSPAILLGRAVAHEVGHLLLETNAHATSGLMRASWSDVEVRNDEPGDWRFDAGALHDLRARLQQRRTGPSADLGYFGCGTD